VPGKFFRILYTVLKDPDSGHGFGSSVGLLVSNGSRFIRALSFCRRRRAHEVKGNGRVLRIIFNQARPLRPFAIGSQSHFGLGMFVSRDKIGPHGDEVCPSFRAVRRVKLARVLRFYADKARRHATDDDSDGLTESAFQHLSTEIDRLVEKGGGYSFAAMDKGDSGWVFCPEYAGGRPLEITPAGWDTRIFLFGPEAGFRRGIGGMPLAGAAAVPVPAHSRVNWNALLL
jgi:hypothetical protein